ncbi:hypothetical protein DY218_27140 [Streptomyces triticagri]|uniref:Uncharacterized protein n=1 Tax=Streptomyces triticagri TaxID=2293568 RepID=A0A372LY42_9ACTN|nr:hypothetical protein [Streptomyces triticagri]RFU83586.1 hypothetical protein DY218_27140 [Streptomyces triticagri]
MTFPIPEDKIGALPADPGPGEHLWTVIVMHRVSDETIRAFNRAEKAPSGLFDGDSLMSIQGPGCYKCEQPYDRSMAIRPCTGTLDLQ